MATPSPVPTPTATPEPTPIVRAEEEPLFVDDEVAAVSGGAGEWVWSEAVIAAPSVLVTATTGDASCALDWAVRPDGVPPVEGTADGNGVAVGVGYRHAAISVTTDCASWDLQLSPAPDPRVTVIDEYRPYRIEGATKQELVAAMAELGPEMEGSDERARARAMWRPTWNVTVDGAVPCTVMSAMVTIEVIIELPEWTPPPDADAGIVDEWERYVGLVRFHEEGHRTIAIRAGGRIADALEALPPADTCDALFQTVDTTGQAVFDEARAQQRAYDVATDHGATQGAAFD